MSGRARRQPSRPVLACARRALLVFGLWLPTAALAAEDTTRSARYADPTGRYDHGVLGDAIEWGALELTLANGRRITHRLPMASVFEDVAPRLADLDHDGNPEVIVVETDLTRGASLAIYDANGKRVATPHIGQTHRWLAPLGAADLDGDGHIEIAYVDRPHLARTLRIWRYVDGKLIPVADQPGLTNHRIGEDTISGGIRACAGRPEIITANANWTRLIASTLRNGKIETIDIGPHQGPASFRAALACT